MHKIAALIYQKKDYTSLHFNISLVKNSTIIVTIDIGLRKSQTGTDWKWWNYQQKTVIRTQFLNAQNCSTYQKINYTSLYFNISLGTNATIIVTIDIGLRKSQTESD